MLDAFSFSSTYTSAALVSFNLAFALILAFLIAYVYRKTHSGLSYSQSFFSTLIIICPITVVVIMVVQNNLYGALGLLGAFALIRFRTIVKETLDISFLFFSLAEGVAIGVGQYSVALLSTIVIVAIIALLAYLRIGSAGGNKSILTVTSAQPLPQNSISDLGKYFGVALNLLSSRMADEYYNYTFSADAKSISNVENFLLDLTRRASIKSYDIISGKEATDY